MMFVYEIIFLNLIYFQEFIRILKSEIEIEIELFKIEI